MGQSSATFRCRWFWRRCSWAIANIHADCRFGATLRSLARLDALAAGGSGDLQGQPLQACYDYIQWLLKNNNTEDATQAAP